MYREITKDELEVLIKDIENNYNFDINMKDFINTIILYELSEFDIYFKGGTSIFKQFNNNYGRFSEDIDLYINSTYYRQNKKNIKAKIQTLTNLDYIHEVTFEKEQSSQNIKVFNVYYDTKYSKEETNIDRGICKIEICLHGGEPAIHKEVKIISMLEQYYEVDFREEILIKCDDILEILVDKLFIIQETKDSEELSKREYRDIYDIVYIINNFEVNKEDLVLPIKNRKNRVTHHLKREYIFNAYKIINNLNESVESYKNIRNSSLIFHSTLEQREIDGIKRLNKLLEEIMNTSDS